MKTLLDNLEQLCPLPPITQSQYLRWRDDPVTQNLFNELILRYLERVTSDSLPKTADEQIIFVNQLEGARHIIDQVMDFTPSGLEDD